MNNKKRNIIVIIIIILLLLLGIFFFFNKKDDGGNKEVEKMEIDTNQDDYQDEETTIDYSRQIALPGWGGFTIEANTKNIIRGFEFHNPESNKWYEDTVYINNQEIETFIVDDSEVSINHLLKLAGIEEDFKEVKSYNSKYFDIYVDNNKTVIKGIKNFNDTQEIVVLLENDEEITLSITCNQNLYYMTFALYLEGDNEDTLLYQSGLVEPGKYIQKMEMTQSLKKGTYNAYVLCQPYKADMATKTNNGIVKITLTVN